MYLYYKQKKPKEAKNGTDNQMSIETERGATKREIEGERRKTSGERDMLGSHIECFRRFYVNDTTKAPELI